MSEESADMVELAGRSFAAAGRHDLDALMSFYAADAVWDMSDVGVGTFEGTAAIRGFFEDWWATWEDHHQEIHEFQDFGGGVLFAAIQEDGRLAGSDRRVEHTRGWVATWANDLVVRMTAYLDIDEARAAAECLAEERGQAISQENVETVRRAIAAINARDIDAYLACCTEGVELLLPMVGSEYVGADGVRRFFTDIEDIGPDFRIEVQRVQAIGDSNALALLRTGSTGRASGIVTGAESANVYDFIDGKISRIRIFLDRDEALKAVGLSG